MLDYRRGNPLKGHVPQALSDRWGSLAGVLLALSLPVAASAQGDSAQAPAESLEPITVSTTRTSQGRPLSAIPGSVTVIEEEQIEQQTRITRDVGEILSNLVPGLGQSSENLTNFGQQLRGRDFLVMIDGVPQNATLRQVSKHLRSLAPEAIERVEVIRGAVATYGIGATGGIINFITKSGQGVRGTAFHSTAGLTAQDEDEDSIGGRLYQGVRGSSGAFDYSVNLSAKRTGVFYDGEEDVIPPDGLIQGGSLAESWELNTQTKLGYQLTPNQRLRLAINYFDREQDAEHRADRSTGSVNPNKKITAEAGDPPGKNPGTENLNLSLDYTAEQVLGGTLSSQFYYQDYETLFSFFSGYPTGGGQSQVTAERIGARLVHDRSVFGLAHAVYGLDFDRERTGQSLLDGRTRFPELERISLAPFLQMEIPLGPDWLLRAGIRHERASLDVPTFQDETQASPGTVRGGELEFNETLFNAGLVYSLTERQEAFFSFSEGFTVADIGRALRGQTRDVSVERIDPEAQVVKNFELGWRGRFDRLQTSATAFLSTSDLGTTFGAPPNFPLQRSEERIYGVELTADYEATDSVRVGGTATYQQGRQDTNNDGSLDDDLPGTRITPPEVTAYVEYQPSARWSGRVQAKHLFDRKRLDNEGFPNGDVNGFTLVDADAGVQVGPGRLHLAVNNLLDRQYIVPVAQAFNLSRRMVAGRGRSYSLEYSVTY